MSKVTHKEQPTPETTFLHRKDKIQYIKPDFIPREGIIQSVQLVDGKYEYFVSGGERKEVVRCHQITTVNGVEFIDRTDSITGRDEEVFSYASKTYAGFQQSIDPPLNENELCTVNDIVEGIKSAVKNRE